MSIMLHIKKNAIALAICLVFGCLSLANAQTPIQEFKFNNSYTNEAGNVSFASNAGTSFTTDRFGTSNGAININNTGSTATIPNLIYGNGARTVCVWVKLNSFNASGYNFLYSYGAPSTSQSNGGAINSSLAFHLGYNNNHSVATTNTVGVWCFMAFTYDGTTSRIYKNGVLLGSAPYSWNTVNSGSSFFKIGIGVGNELQFNGALDDLQIYNTALTATEVANSYNPGSIPQYSFKFNNVLSDTTNVFSFANNPSISYVADRFGNANSAVNINNSGSTATLPSLPYGSTSRSVAMWVKLNTLNSAGFNFLHNYGTGTTGNGAYLNATNIIHFGSSANHSTTSSTVLNTWMYLVFTYDGTTSKIYRNGVLIGTQTLGLNTVNNSNIFRLGLTEDGIAGFFNGAIDDLKIFNAALTETEVQNLYSVSISVSAPIYQFDFNNSYANTTNSVSFANSIAISFVPDRFSIASRAMRFNNNGTSASLPSLPIGNNSRSVSIWVKMSSISSDNFVFNYGNSVANQCYGFSIQPTTINNYGWANDVTHTVTTPLNTWKHYVVTFNSVGSIVSIYINGVLVKTDTKTGWSTANSTTFYLGQLFSSASLQADIDDLKIYNRTLSPTEVAELYTSESTLPVTLTNFNGKLQNGFVNLNWQTSQEINTSHFEVEYSNNGNNFTKVTELAASGNATTTKSYTATHEINKTASIHYYRLKMIDKDGKFTYSNIVALKANSKGVDVTVYPTIVKNTATLSITTEQNQTGEIVVSNMFGQIVHRKTIVLNAGTNTQQINVSNYAKGSYVVKVILANESKVVKLIRE